MLALKKMETEISCTKARIYSGFYSGIGISVLEEDLPDGTISPRLWKKLSSIDAKLNLILEKLIQNSEGFNQAQNRQVSLSEEDIQILTPDVFSAGDFIEIKMQLPVSTPVWIVLYGMVSQIRSITPEQNEIWIQFSEMDGEVKQLMGYYLFNRHREIVRKQRSASENSATRPKNS
ncbi:MAG: hypothetical protein HY881_08815 [Deltaproteobacteria bacterium]|nr:hypothetical protein [Deltaproteobacteria bacterium]